MFCILRNNSKTDRSQTRRENKTCYTRSAFKKQLSPRHPNENRASMHSVNNRSCWCIHDNDGLAYWWPDKTQLRLFRWGKRSVSIKKCEPQYPIMSNRLELLLPGQTLTSYSVRESSAIPTPVTTVSSVTNLNISHAVAVCVWEVCNFFLIFCIAPGG